MNDRQTEIYILISTVLYVADLLEAGRFVPSAIGEMGQFAAQQVSENRMNITEEEFGIAVTRYRLEENIYAAEEFAKTSVAGWPPKTNWNLN